MEYTTPIHTISIEIHKIDNAKVFFLKDAKANKSQYLRFYLLYCISNSPFVVVY
jgi:hypothetical protein